MSYKKCKVIMLPYLGEGTNNCIFLDHNGILSQDMSFYFRNCYRKHHLYILSDEEIKEGDWYMLPNNVVTKAVTGYKRPNDYKKIIATADKSLRRQNIMMSMSSPYLPQIPQDFITKYIEEYNKGNKIEEVLVEYDERKCTKCGAINPVNSLVCQYPISPMPCSRNLINTPRVCQNYISIKPIKDSWNRDEVLKLVHNAWLRGSLQHESPLDEQSYTNFIKENL